MNVTWYEYVHIIHLTLHILNSSLRAQPRNRQRRENTKKERDALLAQPKDATPGSADDGKVAAGAYKTDLIPIRTWGCGCGRRIS